MSLAILTFFMMEIFFKIFVFRLEFFHHKFEILDTIVVVISFILDLVLLFREHQFEALGLLILLRLWRVARIINGMSPALLSRGAGGGRWGVGQWVEPGRGAGPPVLLLAAKRNLQWSALVSHCHLCGYKLTPVHVL